MKNYLTLIILLFLQLLTNYYLLLNNNIITKIIVQVSSILNFNTASFIVLDFAFPFSVVAFVAALPSTVTTVLKYVSASSVPVKSFPNTIPVPEAV